MSNIKIYDKAKYHYEGDFPVTLDRSQAFVHIGMFLGWLVEAGLISASFGEDFKLEIKDCVDRKITGPALLRLVGGVLASDMLNVTGNRFALNYYEEGAYLDDYCELLVGSLPTIYHVEDTWINFDRLKWRIDQRYSEFNKKKGQ